MDHSSTSTQSGTRPSLVNTQRHVVLQVSPDERIESPSLCRALFEIYLGSSPIIPEAQYSRVLLQIPQPPIQQASYSCTLDISGHWHCSCLQQETSSTDVYIVLGIPTRKFEVIAAAGHQHVGRGHQAAARLRERAAQQPAALACSQNYQRKMMHIHGQKVWQPKLGFCTLLKCWQLSLFMFEQSTIGNG